eukprot:Platyproteum_vivax@DN7172_c0_g1_i1.p1
MRLLSYRTGVCILEFMKAEDIQIFALICKEFRSYCDEKAFKQLLGNRFKELKFDLKFDAERRKASKVKTDFHWLFMLEENLSLIMNEPRLLIHHDMWWARCGGTNTIQLTKALSELYQFNLPNGYTVVDVAFLEVNDSQIGFFEVAVIGQPPLNSDTELWIGRVQIVHKYSIETNKFFGKLKKLRLPLRCKCIKRLVFTAKLHLCILSEAGILWFWSAFGSGDVEHLRCLEPVFKVTAKARLCVTGSLYDRYSEVVPSDIKFTDIRQVGSICILKDGDGRFYKYFYFPANLLEPYDIQKFLPTCFNETNDWSVGYAGRTCMITFVSNNMTVCHWNLKVAVPKVETHVLRRVISSAAGCRKSRSSLHQSGYSLLYLAANGTLYCSLRSSSYLSRQKHLNLYIDGPNSDTIIDLYASSNRT